MKLENLGPYTQPESDFVVRHRTGYFWITAGSAVTVAGAIVIAQQKFKRHQYPAVLKQDGKTLHHFART